MRLYLAYIFIIACIHKIAHPEMFALDVATYDMLPLSLINITAIVLPWVELMAGIMLVLGYKTRAGALMVAGMMLMFIIALTAALYKGLDMSCGCFASQAVNDEDPISYKTVLRDIVWIGLALWVLIFDANPLGLDRLVGEKETKDD
jgi:uncharacterized membrane protein YphA (DoxX/SURF4 family)